MSFRNKYIFLVLVLVSLAALSFQFLKSLQGEDDFSAEMPAKLSPTKDTLLVTHVHRSCECPEWFANGDSSRFLYLEPKTYDLPTSEILARRSDSGAVLQLYGSFYNRDGIPNDYPGIRAAARLAPVFQYESLETLNSGQDQQ